MRVAGIDLSLTSTGVAFALGEGAEVSLTTKTYKSKTTDMSLSARAGRLWRLTHPILMDLCEFAPDLVLVEGPSYGNKTGSHHDRSGYWWMVVKELLDAGLQVAEVTPSTLKKYATGTGNANKEAVVIAVTRRYPQVEFTTNDEADAVILAAIGRRILGQPLEDSLPKANLDATKGFPKVEVPVGQ